MRRLIRIDGKTAHTSTVAERVANNTKLWEIFISLKCLEHELKQN